MPPCAAAAAAAASLRRFLVSAADRHHPGVAPALVPQPDVHLVEPAAVARVPLRVGGGVSKTLIVLEAAWDGGATVASDEAQNEGGGAPARWRLVGHRIDVKVGQVLVAGRVT